MNAKSCSNKSSIHSFYFKQRKSQFSLLKLLQHDNTHTTTLSSIDLILGVNARRYICGTVVEEVVVQLTISRAEFLIDEEEGVIEECEGVEDVEFGLFPKQLVLCLQMWVSSGRSINSPVSQESKHP